MRNLIGVTAIVMLLAFFGGESFAKVLPVNLTKSPDSKNAETSALPPLPEYCEWIADDGKSAATEGNVAKKATVSSPTTPSSFTGGLELGSFTTMGNESSEWIFPIIGSVFGKYTHSSGFGARVGLSGGVWITESAAPGLFGIYAEGLKEWHWGGVFAGGMVFYAISPQIGHTGYLWGLARGGGEVFLLDNNLSLKAWASITTFDQLIRHGGLGVGLSFAYTF